GPAAAIRAAFCSNMRKLRLYRLLVLLGVAAMLLPVGASAQTGLVRAYINDVIGPQEIPTASGLPGLSYEVDLTLLDADQNVVSAVGVVSATMSLEPGGPYPAQVQQLQGPWTMVVLIDA